MFFDTYSTLTQQNAAKNEAGKAAYDPATDPHVEGDAFKTLFVARLSPETTENALQKEFEEYGPIKRVRLVTDAQGKSRGYAFLEFEHRNDMKMAYKMADGKKIDGRRVLVDVERGRTVPDWCVDGFQSVMRTWQWIYNCVHVAVDQLLCECWGEQGLTCAHFCAFEGKAMQNVCVCLHQAPSSTGRRHRWGGPHHQGAKALYGQVAVQPGPAAPAGNVRF